MMEFSRRELAGVGATAVISAGLALEGRSAFIRWRSHRATQAVHPELRDLAQALLEQPAQPPLSAATLDRFRRSEADNPPPAQPSPRLVWHEAQRIRGAPPVRVIVINGGAAGRRRPAILYVHGGGFVMGTAAGQAASLQRLAAALDCVIVSVDYRLAPETLHAAMVDDAYAALRFVHGQAASLGVDPARIAIMGVSAGGGLAALLAMRARDAQEVPLVFQALIYPMLDDHTGSINRPAASPVPLMWNEQQNRFGWRSFLGHEPGGPDVPVEAVPARRHDLAGLPPTFIGVGSLDLFLAEDLLFARRLTTAGVPSQVIVVPGAFHAFDIAAPSSGVARRFVAAITQAFAHAFAAQSQD